MAETHDFAGSTHHFGPPPGLEDRIGWLHLFANGNHVVSAWKPTPAELEKLNNGESMFMSVMSGSRLLLDGDGAEVRVPIVFPVFMGDEETTKMVITTDGGDVW